ncbi:hypothetical protein GXN74_06230 [Clostridiales bacterium F-3ap]|uniref:Putative Flp pilus-assembly TadG-like N-terminal domain-containing protein n=2 Tax=Anaerotalea alkaliphila TaxID=2662126 RepID=A0A7X5HVD9_9FIRM|nr:hypothetical protein [Anaerotalea alkaliphila]
MQESWYNRGSVTILVAAGMVAFLGFAALVLDVGYLYAERVKLSNGIDAAALAGAAYLPDKSALARSEAEGYLAKNGIDPAEVAISIGEGGSSISLQAARELNLFFAPVLGIGQGTVAAENEIVVGPLASANMGLRPFAMEYFPYSYGDQVQLLEGPGDGYSGNYNAIYIKPKSADENVNANTFYELIRNGYTGPVKIGDWKETDTGVKPQTKKAVEDTIAKDPAATRSTVLPGSPRLWTIPIVSTLEVSGSKSVQIVGFAQFFIEDYASTSRNVLTGTFLRFIAPGEIDTSGEAWDTGAYGYKMTK